MPQGLTEPFSSPNPPWPLVSQVFKSAATGAIPFVLPPRTSGTFDGRPRTTVDAYARARHVVRNGHLFIPAAPDGSWAASTYTITLALSARGIGTPPSVELLLDDAVIATLTPTPSGSAWAYAHSDDHDLSAGGLLTLRFESTTTPRTVQGSLSMLPTDDPAESRWWITDEHYRAGKGGCWFNSPSTLAPGAAASFVPHVGVRSPIQGRSTTITGPMLAAAGDYVVWISGDGDAASARGRIRSARPGAGAVMPITITGGGGVVDVHSFDVVRASADTAEWVPFDFRETLTLPIGALAIKNGDATYAASIDLRLNLRPV